MLDQGKHHTLHAQYDNKSCVLDVCTAFYSFEFSSLFNTHKVSEGVKSVSQPIDFAYDASDAMELKIRWCDVYTIWILNARSNSKDFG